jgi:SAM-dependent methyltransferase
MTAAESRAEVLTRLRSYVERARGFSGWQFSGVRERALVPLSWDYPALVRRYAVGARSVLDMDTGGGELLARLRDGLPPFVVATEEWHVNAPVAYRRLAPLGLHVVRAGCSALPFADASFDLVINRHGALAPAEVARVLRAGGRFVSQQVGARNWQELRHHFPRMREPDHTFADYESELIAVGLCVTARDNDRPVAYATLGDVAYMLTVTPWTIPDFDVERDLEALLALEAAYSTIDGVVLTENRCLIIAEKPL